jgi:hypothetical protein
MRTPTKRLALIIAATGFGIALAGFVPQVSQALKRPVSKWLL